MSEDHYRTMGIELRKDSLHLEPKALFFAMLLVMSHLLEIKPSDFDAGGIKIQVRDIVVIHGCIASIYLYYFMTLVLYEIEKSSLLRMDSQRAVVKRFIRAAKKPFRDEKTKRMRFRTAKEVKRYAKNAVLAYSIFLTPFAIVFLLLIGAALVIGVRDFWDFGWFIYGRADILWR